VRFDAKLGFSVELPAAPTCSERFFPERKYAGVQIREWVVGDRALLYMVGLEEFPKTLVPERDLLAGLYGETAYHRVCESPGQLIAQAITEGTRKESGMDIRVGAGDTVSHYRLFERELSVVYFGVRGPTDEAAHAMQLLADSLELAG
jgi:hypothetical protein